MSLPRQPFVGLTLSAIAGIVAADYFPTLTIPLCALIVVGALVAMRWPAGPLVYVVVATTFFTLHSARVVRSPSRELAERVGNKPIAAVVDGVVATEPKTAASGDAVFLLRVRELEIEGRKDALPALLQVHWPRAPQLGDELSLFGTIETIHGARNPGEFDMREYLARRDVFRTFIVHDAANGRILQRGTRFRLLRAPMASRQWMQRTLSRGIEDAPDVIGLICGTSLGLRHESPEDIEEPFQQTGTLHLFAVAGLHVGIVARLLWTVAMVLRFPRKLATALIIPALFFYAAITGWHTASVRAAVMSALLLGGIFFDRKVLALNSLAAAAFLILLFDSAQLFTVGFQLSFTVVGCIVLLADPLFRLFQRITAPDPFLPRALFHRLQKMRVAILHALCRGASVSLAAWIGSLPLIYWYFHLITPISLFANLAVVPIAYFVLALALLSLLAASISVSASVIFNNANWLASKIVLALVHLFALVPGGHLCCARFTDPGELRSITVLDEGAGGAVYVRANGYDWLLDCGPARSYERTLKAFLHSRGVDRLEGLVLTHGDAQHIGGAFATISDFAPREIFDNPLDVRSTVQARLRTELRRRGTPLRSLVRDEAILLGPDVRAQVLYPPPQLKIASADDGPLVLQIDFGDTRVIYENDAGSAVEQALLKYYDDLRSDILIKGHHHSGDAGSLAFIDAVQPRVIIATSRDTSVSERIDDAWAAEIARRGIKLFRQDESGAVEIQLREEEWTARAFLSDQYFRAPQ
ncbi:MAG: ComEC/Rec2 family competence protein [Verrucomicrobiota bacterium]|nr:ComEC/Rec2 family competence protein [Verrucomicrobiota bacterium]